MYYTEVTKMTTATYNRELASQLSREIFSEYYWHAERGNTLYADAWLNAYNRSMDNFGNVDEFMRSLSGYVANMRYRANKAGEEYEDIEEFFETRTWKRYVANDIVLEYLRTHILPRLA